MKERIKEIVRKAYEEEQISFSECNIVASEESYLVVITCTSYDYCHEKARAIIKIKKNLESELLRMKNFKILKNFIIMELFPFEYEGT